MENGMERTGPLNAPPEAADETPAGPPRKLADIVHDQVFRLIARGEFPAGCKLPPEEALGARFGVSRPVVRAALARLREHGYVRSQRGSGSVVIRGEEPGAFRFPPIRTVADLLRSYEFRITVEAAAAALAAERRTEADIEAIAATLEQARDVLADGALHLLPDLNYAFHRAVGQSTQNPFYLHTLEMLPTFVGRDRVDQQAFGAEDQVRRQRQVHAEHGTIFEAVRQGDTRRARLEMERHIASARDYVLERQTLGNGPLWRLSPA
jgi:GntR family transcriptional regulator, transcriptional repressor for pyruvate dehydrogenase complex